MAKGRFVFCCLLPAFNIFFLTSCSAAFLTPARPSPLAGLFCSAKAEKKDTFTITHSPPKKTPVLPRGLPVTWLGRLRPRQPAQSGPTGVRATPAASRWAAAPRLVSPRLAGGSAQPRACPGRLRRSVPLLPRPHRRLTFLSQIWSGLLPMLYSTERNPLWNVFLNMPGPRRAGPGAPLPPPGPGPGATALRKDTADLPRIPPRLRPALPGRGGSAAVTRELLSAPAGCRRIYFRPLLRERGVTGARVAVATGLGGAGPGGRRRRRRPRAGAGGAGPGGRRRRPRAGAGRAGWRGPPSLRHSGAAPWGGRRRPRAGPGWSVPACRALRLATGVERWRTRPCRGLRRTPWSARLASTPGTRRRCWLPLAPGVEVPARR